MPKKVGGSTSVGRERITVWASFDGGKTWPVKRLVYDGPSAYSNLGVGRAGTPSAGKIFLNYEGGVKNCYEAVYVAVFNLSWLLNGRALHDVLRR
jgi:sialidase-1